jgi:hypothetical protein
LRTTTDRGLMQFVVRGVAVQFGHAA